MELPTKMELDFLEPTVATIVGNLALEVEEQKRLWLRKYKKTSAAELTEL